ncbi:MAG: metabolite traffic protein EboE [Gemmatimonadetes bacterium]|nr:metabolite traffic protein EboE [Gemmatimonadota bacterium]
MKLGAPGGPHLTYCTNIHPGENWPEVRDNVERYATAVKRSVAPDRPFGVGLRLSAAAADALARRGELDAFRALLDAHGLYVFTLNGFPYGPFHGQPVKERVYLPDWLDPERLRYTDRLAGLLAALLPDGMEGTVSTVPGAFAPRVTSHADEARMAEMLVRHAATLHRIREETGKRIALALEPEPCCHLETSVDAVGFWERHLFAPRAIRSLAAHTGMADGASEAFLREHLGVCLDACHLAVEWEEPAAALERFRRAGIRVPKVQLSAGLEAAVSGPADPRLDALAAFVDPVYLHQVVERTADGRLLRDLDLPDALARARREPERERLWRIHFHVPLFRERLGPFANTQPWLGELIRLLRREPVPPHLEVETYSWDVLPERFRGEPVTDAIARELDWVRERWEAPPG